MTISMKVKKIVVSKTTGHDVLWCPRNDQPLKGVGCEAGKIKTRARQ
jgi:hypothetical protein